MTTKEIKDIAIHCTVLVDTREKETELLKQRIREIENLGAKTERKCLPFGDYSASIPTPKGTTITFENMIVIERKQSLEELITCFTTHHERFTAEIERCTNAGAKMIVLVENSTLDDLLNRRYKNNVMSKSVINAYCTYKAKYNVSFEFCDNKSTPEFIYQTLVHYVYHILLKKYREIQESKKQINA